MLDQSFLIGALTSLLSALVGGAFVAIVSHTFSAKRDTRNKQRELRVKNLIEIFEAFDSSDLVPPEEEKRALEIAVSKVQLFGDEILVEYTRKFLDAMKINGSQNIDDFMRKLRAEIRSELGLSPLNTDFVILRYNELPPLK
ncbi:MAG: hypothetical protein ABI230_04620 [Aestuariivirga sp.]